MEFEVDSHPSSTMYKLIIGSIVPRPIGWISTVNEQGQPNLAPFSFFNGVSGSPPHVLFCPTIRGTDGGRKDSLHNVRATGEFVANIVTEDLAEAMNISATEFPPDVNEFEAAGVTTAPSQAVRPPRVAESPVNFECKVAQIVDIGPGGSGGNVVIGEVLHIQVADRVLFNGDKVDIEKLRPIGRLAGSSYCRVRDIFELHRLPSQIST